MNQAAGHRIKPLCRWRETAGLIVIDRFVHTVINNKTRYTLMKYLIQLYHFDSGVLCQAACDLNMLNATLCSGMKLWQGMTLMLNMKCTTWHILELLPMKTSTCTSRAVSWVEKPNSPAVPDQMELASVPNTVAANVIVSSSLAVQYVSQPPLPLTAPAILSPHVRAMPASAQEW